MKLFNPNVYIYIYIYVERERERTRENENKHLLPENWCCCDADVCIDPLHFHRFPVHSIPVTHTFHTCLWLTCLRELFRYCVFFLRRIIIEKVYFSSVLSKPVDVHLMSGGGARAWSQDWFLPRWHPLAFRWPVHLEADSVPCRSKTAQQNVWQGRSITLTFFFSEEPRVSRKVKGGWLWDNIQICIHFRFSWFIPKMRMTCITSKIVIQNIQSVQLYCTSPHKLLSYLSPSSFYSTLSYLYIHTCTHTWKYTYTNMQVKVKTQTVCFPVFAVLAKDE